MVEVPGMTRPALDALSEPEIAKLRWATFARALKGTVRADLAGELQDLSDADSPPSSGTLKARRGRRREELVQAIAAQAKLRHELLLDDVEVEVES